MDQPVLVASRWQISEFLFIEFLKSDCILFEIGPFPEEPTDEEIDKAYTYLEAAQLDYLALGELEWTLDLDHLSTRFPALVGAPLTGKLTHEPAFETFQPSTAPRFFTGRWDSDKGYYVLRIPFDFKASPEST